MSAEGWQGAFDPSTCMEGGLSTSSWLMSDTGSAFCEIRPERRQHVRHDIAASLGAVPRELAIQPAHLAANDFAHQGTHARTVLAALRHTDFLPSNSARHVICFIDARPIMLSITWKICVDGVFDSDAVARRFAGRCPTGYVISILRGDLTPLQLGFHAQAEAGEVFTIVFEPFQIIPGDPSPPGPPPDEGDDEDSQSGNDQMPDDQGNILPEQDGLPVQCADTGGTGLTSNRSCSGSSSDCVVMWPAMSRLDAVPAGTWWITPIGIVRGSRGSGQAVCRLDTLVGDFVLLWSVPRSPRDVVITATASSLGRRARSVSSKWSSN